MYANRDSHIYLCYRDIISNVDSIISYLVQSKLHKEVSQVYSMAIFISSKQVLLEREEMLNLMKDGKKCLI